MSKARSQSLKRMIKRGVVTLEENKAFGTINVVKTNRNGKKTVINRF